MIHAWWISAGSQAITTYKVTDEAELVRYWPGGESACLHVFFVFLVYNSTLAALKSDDVFFSFSLYLTFEAKTRSETRVCTAM